MECRSPGTSSRILWRCTATTWLHFRIILPKFAPLRALCRASADSSFNLLRATCLRPGDSVDALVAMNPAALKMNVADLRPNGILIVNADSFGETDLRKAQMQQRIRSKIIRWTRSACFQWSWRS